MSANTEASDAGDEAVPKLPRGRGLKFSRAELFRIFLTGITLVALIIMARPCADAVSGFVMGLEDEPGKQSMPKPATVDQPVPQQFEQLRPGMTEAEIKQAIERSKARAAGSGSGAP